MICHVIINDFEISRRMKYVLDDMDFDRQRTLWHDTDELLIAAQSHDLFKGRTRWSQLEIKHFHIMIVNMLKILSAMNDEARGDKTNAAVMRLAFFLCSLIFLLQEKTGYQIELLRVNRVSPADVVYDFNASLDVKIEPVISHSGLKVVIDNGNEV